MFKSLLDISKLDSDTFEVELETVKLQPLLASLVEQNEQFIAWHRVEFRFVPTNVSVRADATLLTTIIQNLLSNAIKYARGGRVLLGVRRRGDTVSIEIHDQGIGINSKHLPRIFDEFYRGHVAGDYDSEGVGLGLSIVKRLASLCGLSITLDSVRGQGTTVQLSNIPRTTDVVPVSSASIAEAPQPLAGLRVILIEDDPDVLKATTQILERWGCLVAPHSKMLLKHSDTDLVIADFDLGNGATGVDAIQAIRAKLGRQVPAILMTGHSEEYVRSQIQPNSISLLTKPVQPATLRSLLSAIRISLLDQA